MAGKGTKQIRFGKVERLIREYQLLIREYQYRVDNLKVLKRTIDLKNEDGELDSMLESYSMLEIYEDHIQLYENIIEDLKALERP